MDWRTNYSTLSGSPDVIFKYDYANKRFRNEEDTQTIDGTYQKCWDLVNGLNLITTGLEDYWANSVGVITSQTGNHPRLVWGPYPNENFVLDYYEIYKKKDNSPFQLLASTTTESYIDVDEVIPLIPETVVPVWNKIKAVCELEDDSFVSDYSNTVDINVEGGLSKYVVEINKGEFSLFQNYPNPFNPTTTISWTSPADNFVTLKVFDVLGREVATLVNEYKSAGEHSIDFNAQELSSGIYIYRIQIGEYNKARNLILQK